MKSAEEQEWDRQMRAFPRECARKREAQERRREQEDRREALEAIKSGRVFNLNPKRVPLPHSFDPTLIRTPRGRQFA